MKTIITIFLLFYMCFTGSAHVEDSKEDKNEKPNTTSQKESVINVRQKIYRGDHVMITINQNEKVEAVVLNILNGDQYYVRISGDANKVKYVNRESLSITTKYSSNPTSY